MTNRDLKSFDRVAHLYDASRGVPPDVQQAITLAIVKELASSEAPRLLEVGIGTGRIAVPLAAEGVRVTGIDISTKMLGILREKRSDIDLMLAEASKPPLKPASFDAALFVHILHLVPDPKATMSAVLPLVRPGGAILQGTDSRAGGTRGAADTIIEETINEVTGQETGPWRQRDRGREICEEAVLAAGGSVEVKSVIKWTSHTSGRRILDRLEHREFSSSWRVNDEMMPRVLERVTPRVEALFGDLDREVAFERSFSLLVGRLPS